MSDDHVGVKINGVIYVKLVDVKPMREAIDAAQARIAALEEALTPFADCYSEYAKEHYTDEQPAEFLDMDGWSDLKIGHVRAARAALAAGRE